MRGRLRLAVTWGHNKDHRPDLKQLLYILTVSGDGAVPVHFRVESGNATDDRSHRETWDLLCKLTGRADFLYVADCKLATAENMAHIHRHGGRFLSVLPRTRSEDAAFRARVVLGKVDWRPIHDKRDDEGNLLDQFSICEPAGQRRGLPADLVSQSTQGRTGRAGAAEAAGAGRGAAGRAAQKLGSPRTRYRLKAKVVEAAEAILHESNVGAWMTVEVSERSTPKYRQERRGRPGKETKYVRSEEDVRFDLKHEVDLEGLTEEAKCDGIFPLITDERSLSELQLLLAYKQQPAIERRFEQMKTDFVVAPVYLKETSRIQALLCVYFFVLLVEALLERELRRAMVAKEIEALPLYPEGRDCRRPTARRVIDLFEDVQRHTLIPGQESPVVFTTELTRLQRKILRLLGMSGAYDT